MKLEFNHIGNNKKKSKKDIIVSNGAFPFCGFKDTWSNGVLETEYNEVYCNAFQVTKIANKYFELGVKQSPDTLLSSINLFLSFIFIDN